MSKEITNEHNNKLLYLYDRYNFLMSDLEKYQDYKGFNKKFIKLLNKLERYKGKNTRVIFNGETDPEYTGSLERYLTAKKRKMTYGKELPTGKKDNKGNIIYKSKPYKIKLLDGEYIKSNNIVYKREGDSFKQITIPTKKKTWIPVTTMMYRVDNELIREKIKDSDNETRKKYMFNDVPRFKAITRSTPQESVSKSAIPICDYLFNIEEIVEEIESIIPIDIAKPIKIVDLFDMTDEELNPMKKEMKTIEIEGVKYDLTDTYVEPKKY